jgi:hypothetical protein
MLEINRQFLQHDFYTDIITFPLSDPGQPISGEIYISVDRVRDNAGNLGVLSGGSCTGSSSMAPFICAGIRIKAPRTRN